jgi:hypothetical protein
MALMALNGSNHWQQPSSFADKPHLTVLMMSSLDSGVNLGLHMEMGIVLMVFPSKTPPLTPDMLRGTHLLSNTACTSAESSQ